MLEIFFARNLQIFVVSLSVCPRQAFPNQFNKHSSLVWKFINYGQKSFITLAPCWGVVLKASRPKTQLGLRPQSPMKAKQGAVKYVRPDTCVT